MRDYEQMWRTLYERIENRCEEFANQIHDEEDSLKLRIIGARFLQALEIQRLMDRAEKCEHHA